MSMQYVQPPQQIIVNKADSGLSSVLKTYLENQKEKERLKAKAKASMTPEQQKTARLINIFLAISIVIAIIILIIIFYMTYRRNKNKYAELVAADETEAKSIKVGNKVTATINAEITELGIPKTETITFTGRVCTVNGDTITVLWTEMSAIGKTWTRKSVPSAEEAIFNKKYFGSCRSKPTAIDLQTTRGGSSVNIVGKSKSVSSKKETNLIPENNYNLNKTRNCFPSPFTSLSNEQAYGVL